MFLYDVWHELTTYRVFFFGRTCTAFFFFFATPCAGVGGSKFLRLFFVLYRGIFCVLLLQSYREKISIYFLFMLIVLIYTVCRISRTNNTNIHTLMIFMVYFAIFTAFCSHVAGYLSAHDMYAAYYSR